GLGRKDPADYSYVLGLPAWVFYRRVVVDIVAVGVVTMGVRLVVTDLPLAGDGGDERCAGRRLCRLCAAGRSFLASVYGHHDPYRRLILFGTSIFSAAGAWAVLCWR